MSIDDCMREFRLLASEIFERPRKIHFRRCLWWSRDVYNQRKYERLLQSIVKRNLNRSLLYDELNDYYPQLESEQCKTYGVYLKDVR
jgi:hypothetical protein